MKAIYRLIIVLAFFSSSCTKESFVKQVPYPAQNSNKLVVISYINPTDELIKVSVSSSRPAYGPGVGKVDLNVQIKNAVVIISDNEGKSAHVPWNDEIGQYALEKEEFSISAGKIYRLKVSAHGKSISAQTSVPQAIKGQKFTLIDKIISKDHLGGTGSINNQYWYKFSVPSDGLVEGGYYACYPILDRITRYNNDYGNNSQEDTYDSSSKKTGKVFFRTYERASNALPFDHLMVIEDRVFDDYFYSDRVVTYAHTGVFIACSKEYYLFHKTAPNNIKIAKDNGNPLAPPTSNVYSNIEGGYGIFAGYNEVSVTY